VGEVDARNNSPELIHPGYMRNRFPRVLGIAREPEGLGTVERDGVPRLARTVPVCALEGGFFGGFCLGIFGCGWREGD
jgi:hypothetical protein